MELTIRTPYQTILKGFDGFARILARTNEVKNKIFYILGCPCNIK